MRTQLPQHQTEQHDIATDCGGNAHSVTTTPDRTACLCFCSPGYIGASCSSCGPTGPNGYIEEAGQCIQCTIPTHCTPTGTDVVTADNGVCVCNCKDQWVGDKCDSCPVRLEQTSCDKCAVGYINYPTCDQCNVIDHCSGHATSVTSDPANKFCTDCVCTNSWTGSSCDSCAAIYTQADCDQCAEGHFAYDVCTLCTVKDHCSNHASTVVPNSQKTKCDCTCNHAWTGDSCDICPPGIDPATDCAQCLVGYIGFPNCVKCNIATNCNNNADSVTSSPDFLSCQCDCRNMWSGATCSQCNSQFDGADCDVCASGHTGYNICDLCTIADHCENHASAVTPVPDPNPTSCTCTCRNHWELPDCLTCPPQFGGSDCDTCGIHRINYPTCTLCTVNDDCSNHASTVTSNSQQTECVCTCNQKWSGADCSTCPTEYSGLDCNECGTARINYPFCTACTNALHCNGHAVSVSTNVEKTQCACTCDPKYTGSSCNRCATGYIGYPACDQCTVDVHCSSHADSVTSNQGNTVCNCVCTDKWTGSQCQTCPSQFEQTTCNSCSVGHINYATGCESCSISKHCSDHATAVTSDATNMNCNCTCSNSWTGSTCSTCPSKYGGTDCDMCAPGFINYDTCTECTIAADCSNNAVSVGSDVAQKNCVCNCRNQFSGPSCATCPSAFAGAECNQCASDRILYPTCSECSIVTHCSNHATSVAPDASQTGCDCVCDNFWVGPTCSVCPVGYGGANCDQCGIGYIPPMLPFCTKCDVDIHCNGHASSVSSTGTVCVCQCLAGFAGATCDRCDVGYIGYSDRVSCRQCGPSDCNSNSQSVTSNSDNTACVCTCENSWTGTTCDSCPANFDSSAAGDCGKCAVGFINYPTCVECDPTLHCSGHASVATTVTGCFTNVGLGCCSDTKTVLTSGYFGSVEDCQQKCRDTPNCGYVEHGWKNFQTFCTVIQVGTCQYHGIDTCGSKPANDGVSTYEFDSTCYNDRCACTCTAQWEGIVCDTCPSQFSPTGCDSCSEGHINYPTCEACNIDIHCSGKAVSATSNLDHTKCVCQCTHHWTGDSCNVCPANFGGPNCDTCAVGFVGPMCVECDLMTNCNNRGTAVTSDPTHQECVCTCENSWTGNSCDTCDSKFDQTTGVCNTCAGGRTDYPICGVCEVDVHCSNHATAVAKNWDNTACVCTCRAHWSGLQCELCDSQYGGSDCDRCAADYFPDPTAPDQCIPCTIAYCHNNAVEVQSNPTFDGCVCKTCKTQFTGTLCETCPDTFSGHDCDQCSSTRINYPTCEECTIDTHCSGNAGYNSSHPQGGIWGTSLVGVYPNALQTECVCVCHAGYVGASCDQCDEHFIMEMGQCVQCSTLQHCSGHATAVSSSTDHSRCECQCSDKWYGDQCDLCDSKYDSANGCKSCSAGRINFPTCTLCDISQHCSGNANTVTASADKQTCECDCMNAYTGPTCSTCPSHFDGNCDRCAAGFINYPTCVGCDVNTHCNGHATSTTSNGDNTACTCSCDQVWTGSTCATCPARYLNDIGSATDTTWQQITRVDISTLTGDIPRTAVASTPCSTGTCKLDDGDITNKLHTYGVENVLFKVVVNNNPSTTRYYAITDSSWVFSSRSVQQQPVCASLQETGPFTCGKTALFTDESVSLTTVTDKGLIGPAASPSNLCAGGSTSGLHGLTKGTNGELLLSDLCAGIDKSTTGTIEVYMKTTTSVSSCNRCSSGHISFPTCTECSVAGHCSSHADAVATNFERTGCVCHCSNSWTGPTCSTCPSTMTGNCDECATGYYNYPECLQCSVSNHCNNHATSVTSNVNKDGCSCTCSSGYTGATCGECTVGFVKSVDTQLSSTCTECTVAANCNGNADSVTSSGGLSQECACSCSNQWTGATCATCPSIFAGANCDRCAEGYINYPTCTQCNIDIHCSGHAATVTSDQSKTSCVCDCSTQWTGSSCSVCPSQYSGGMCNECSKDRINYPQCEPCDLVKHCSGNAVVASSNAAQDTCECQCRNMWTGPSCSTCPLGWDDVPPADCDRCAIGYIPDMSDPSKCIQCSIDVHCTDSIHTSSVTSDHSKCLCTCKGKFTGDSCESCSAMFRQSDCSDCAVGHSASPYPICDGCTVQEHCSNHGTLDPQPGDQYCRCKCDNQWTGSSCSRCPDQYQGANCDTCAVGYMQTSPSPLTCLVCSDAVHCSSRSSAVTSNVDNSACVCTCIDKWTGSDCTTCPAEYDQSTGKCNSCSNNRISYPDCVLCDVAVHCSGNADSTWSDDATTCQCQCKSGFTGSQCESCDNLYIGYPSCQLCTNAADCNGHGVQVVTDNQHLQCSCAGCVDQWTGSSCENCPSNYHHNIMADTCNECAQGRINYPTCSLCTSQYHCNNRADSVVPNAAKTGCVCDCSNSWTGDVCEICPVGFGGTSCDECASGYIGYPSCTRCDSVTHCNGNSASVVSDPLHQTCICNCGGNWMGATCDSCRPPYDGPDCNECATGFINFPYCEMCNLNTHCSGHATSFTGTTPTSCTCKCSDQWTGDACETCPGQFTGTKCDMCAPGYITYPTCRKCSTTLDCNGNANTVLSNVDNTACECHCKAGYAGADCSECDTTYVMEGGVCVECTTAQHCSDHATLVKPDAMQQSCECTCRNKWSSSDCRTCESKYLPGGDCNQCNAGFINYPECEPCDVSKHCFGNAHTATSDLNKKSCICSCKNSWSGSDCSVCSPEYAKDLPAVNDCGGCAPHHVGYPTCRLCDATDDCSGHTDLSSPNSGASSNDGLTCTCSCRNKWSGDKCDICPPEFGGADCNQCKPGHINYPSCTKCQVAAHCSGNAVGVTTTEMSDINTPGTCVCTCLNKFYGSDCSQCDPNFDASKDCGACAPNFNGHGYPVCGVCTVKSHCSDHANGVNEVTTANGYECNCDCKNQWYGSSCEYCPTGYTGECDRCAVGYFGYPQCTLCVADLHCSDHATNVTSNADHSGCFCECRNYWEGDTCSTCPQKYSYADDCGKCAENHVNYPFCEKCTIADSCNDNAVSVATNTHQTACTCSCKVGYTGATCNVCEPGYLKVSDSPVQCTLCTLADCTSAQHSSNAVASVDQSKCVCTCKSNFEGDKCDSCPSQFDPSTCADCAPGRIKYPECILCSNVTHCSGHAESVTANSAKTGCDCVCANKWTGSQCNSCPANWGGSNCDECADGYYLDGVGDCLKCDVATHCNDHAISTFDHEITKTKCSCNCRNQWKGDTCDSCDAKYDSTQDCGACAPDHITYPFCNECTIIGHCSDHATSVVASSSQDTCLCTCKNSWTGDSCEICPAAKTGSECDKCAPGRILYPECKLCTIAEHCSGHADTVVTDAGMTKCECSCSTQWSGATCSTCPDKYQGPNCDMCAVGRINYPICEQCDTDVHCSGNTNSTYTDILQSKCICGKCNAQWIGDTCDTCPSNFDATRGCAECADGYVNYPTCTKCTVAAHCSNHASAVQSNGDRTACTCTCDNKWVAPACSICPGNYSGTDCDRCRTGFTNFPICGECTNEAHCSNHSKSVTSNMAGTDCVCDCEDMWSGLTCDVCDVQYGGDSCNACSVGYITKDFTPGSLQCEQCTNATHCSGHAAAVTAKSGDTNCTCDCMNHWEGSNCETCPGEFEQANCLKCNTGRINYPTCTVCDAITHCSNHGSINSTNVDQTACLCDCFDNWQGDSCNECDARFDQTTCNKCADGRISYPTCELCSIDVHCQGNAISVRADPTATKCLCECVGNWHSASGAAPSDWESCDICPDIYSGSQCSTCAAGRQNDYPTCSLCCGGNGFSSGSTTAGSGCQCICRAKWGPSGTDKDACTKCPAGYDAGTCSFCDQSIPGFTTEEFDCKCVDEYCNSHGTASISMAGKCTCTCRYGWTGDRCDVCDSSYFPDGSCDKCHTGYYGNPAEPLGCSPCSSSTPLCMYGTAKVTVVSDPSLSVPSSLVTTCTCTACKNKFYGTTCDQCDSTLYDPTACGSCAASRYEFPTCKICDESVCNNRGTATVRADGKKCLCNCNVNRWTGETCGICPEGFKQGGQCDTCEEGYFGLNLNDASTTCTKCDTDYCTSQYGPGMYAVSSPNECDCKCRSGCGTGWPVAYSQGPVYNCSCICPPGTQYTPESRCTECPSKYSATCDSCASGFILYPTCSECSIDVHCNGLTHSNRATLVDKDTCSCSCIKGWSSDRCDVCASPYALGPEGDCDRCVDGYAGKDGVCTVCDSVFCSGNGRAISGISCTCECTDKWTGPNCDQCDTTMYSATCDSCAASRFGYPTCTLCDSSYCSGHGTAVIDPVTDTCVCTCDPNTAFEGDLCNTCPSVYGPPDSCNECATQQATSFPNCFVCDATAADGWCHGHGLTASLTPDGHHCNCTCSNFWQPHGTGPLACSICPPEYGGDNCDQCAPGNTTDIDHGCLCTANWCHNRGIHSAQGPDCVCTKCEGGWGGARCEYCPPNFRGDNCDECAHGYFGNPKQGICTLCDASMCQHGSPTVVQSDTSDITKCTCGVCKGYWSGEMCDVCSSPLFNETCNGCKPGAYDFPNCVSCDSSHCNDHADGWSIVNDKCQCECSFPWTSDLCDVCPPEMELKNGQCVCRENYFGFNRAEQKRCMLCDESYCSAVGVISGSGKVEGDRCVCTCKSMFTSSSFADTFNGVSDCGKPQAVLPGLTCDYCPPCFSGVACDKCADGRYDYPECVKCSNQQSCNNHGIASIQAVNGIKTCNCECLGQWTGIACTECPSPYDIDSDGDCTMCIDPNGIFEEGCIVPDCPASVCNNRAIPIRQNNGECGCLSCQDRWDGSACDVCPDTFKIEDGQCASCSDTRYNYPKCEPCTDSYYCNGHGVASKIADRDLCSCQCTGNWYGEKCDKCPIGFRPTTCQKCDEGFKTVPGANGEPDRCVCDCGTEYQATVIPSSGGTCRCSCNNAWQMDAEGRCTICPSLYEQDDLCNSCKNKEHHYPDCVCVEGPESPSCSGRGFAQLTNSSECVCSCDNFWSGKDCNQCLSKYGGEDCDTCANPSATPELDCRSILYRVQSQTDCNGPRTPTVDEPLHITLINTPPINVAGEENIASIVLTTDQLDCGKLDDACPSGSKGSDICKAAEEGVITRGHSLGTKMVDNIHPSNPIIKFEGPPAQSPDQLRVNNEEGTAGMPIAESSQVYICYWTAFSGWSLIQPPSSGGRAYFAISSREDSIVASTYTILTHDPTAGATVKFAVEGATPGDTVSFCEDPLRTTTFISDGAQLELTTNQSHVDRRLSFCLSSGEVIHNSAGSSFFFTIKATPTPRWYLPYKPEMNNPFTVKLSGDFTGATIGYTRSDCSSPVKSELYNDITGYEIDAQTSSAPLQICVNNKLASSSGGTSSISVMTEETPPRFSIVEWENSDDLRVSLTGQQQGMLFLAERPSDCWAAPIKAAEANGTGIFPQQLVASRAQFVGVGSRAESYVCYQKTVDSEWTILRQHPAEISWIRKLADGVPSFTVSSGAVYEEANFTIILNNLVLTGSEQLRIVNTDTCDDSSTAITVPISTEIMSLSLPMGFGNAKFCLSSDGTVYSPIPNTDQAEPLLTLYPKEGTRSNTVYYSVSTIDKSKIRLSLFGTVFQTSQVALAKTAADCLSGTVLWTPTWEGTTMKSSMLFDYLPGATRHFVCYAQTAGGSPKVVGPNDGSGFDFFLAQGFTRPTGIMYSVQSRGIITSGQEVIVALKNAASSTNYDIILTTNGDCSSPTPLPGTVATGTVGGVATLTVKKYLGAMYLCAAPAGTTDYKLVERQMTLGSSRSRMVLQEPSGLPKFSVIPGEVADSQAVAGKVFRLKLIGGTYSGSAKVGLVPISWSCGSNWIPGTGAPVAAASEVFFTPRRSQLATVCFSPDGINWKPITTVDNSGASYVVISESTSYTVSPHPAAYNEITITTHAVVPGAITLSSVECSIKPSKLWCRGISGLKPCETLSSQQAGEIKFIPVEKQAKVYVCHNGVSLPLSDGSGLYFSLPVRQVNTVYDVEVFGDNAVENEAFNITIDQTCSNLDGGEIPLVAITGDPEGCGLEKWADGGRPQKERLPSNEFTITDAGSKQFEPHYVCISVDGGDSFVRLNRSTGIPETMIEIPEDGVTRAGTVKMYNISASSDDSTLEILLIIFGILLCCCLMLLIALYYRYRKNKGELEDFKNNINFEDVELDERLIDPDFVNDGGDADEKVKMNKENPLGDIDDML
eukprot:TRINITY_DN298_c0_g1_i7.p1 TRINITY_DN298_c0_g1~~TRINITY_DN298_c0_g1_i7.p1  ORF type:complete len:6169 (+),score=1117.83 TRINITY_DN298_c0_g1_i7:8252-26758(+)